MGVVSPRRTRCARRWKEVGVGRANLCRRRLPGLRQRSINRAFGRFSDSGKPPKVSTTGPAAFPVPTAVGSAVNAAPGTQTIAFRVWMGPMGATHSPYAGGLHYAPVLGEAGAIEAQTRLAWLEL